MDEANNKNKKRNKSENVIVFINTRNSWLRVSRTGIRVKELIVHDRVLVFC